MDFYPRSPCGERRAREGRRGAKPRISIHALLAESDVRARAAEGQSPEFLSTLSLRRATAREGRRGAKPRDFYPRSPCGERLVMDENQINITQISIHALLAESDRAKQSGNKVNHNFYPRSPCGERRTDTTSAKMPRSISIHALLAESDTVISFLPSQ